VIVPDRERTSATKDHVVFGAGIISVCRSLRPSSSCICSKEISTNGEWLRLITEKEREGASKTELDNLGYSMPEVMFFI
jgi:hypothetical protein